MRVCQRCGDQAYQNWKLLIETENSLSQACDYRQIFIVCEECRQQVFNRLSMAFTDADEWHPPVDNEGDGAGDEE